jgi:hypothetical protein
MNTLILILFLFLVSTGLAQTSRETFLKAINMVENPENHRTPGRHGELGPYQFRPETWRQHTNIPFSQARDSAVSRIIAGFHYDWISEQLRSMGLAVTDYNLAKAWNMGVTAVRLNRRSTDYPQRVVNLCRAFTSERVAVR